MGKTLPSGTTTYSAKAPSRVTPTAVWFSHWFGSLRWHAGQRLHGMFGSAVTRSPGRKRVTRSPTASTVPLNSCPGIRG